MKDKLEQAQWSICVRLPRLRLAMTTGFVTLNEVKGLRDSSLGSE